MNALLLGDPDVCVPASLQTRFRAGRHAALLPLFLMLSCLVGGANALSDPVPAQPDHVLVIGVCDPLCKKSACSCVETEARRDYDAMVAKVEAETGIRLELQYFEEPLKLRSELEEGHLDGMIGKVTQCGALARKVKRDFIRIADITKPAGGSDLRGVFITYKGSPVKKMEDIASHRLGLGPKNDTEKYALPLETLKKHGVKIKAADCPEFFDCKAAALALMEDRADVAVISDYALEYGCIVVVGDPKDFTVIAKTDRAIPFTSFMVESRIPADQREKLAKALLSMTGDHIPEGLFSKGWIKPIEWPPDIPQP